MIDKMIKQINDSILNTEDTIANYADMLKEYKDTKSSLEALLPETKMIAEMLDGYQNDHLENRLVRLQKIDNYIRSIKFNSGLEEYLNDSKN